MKNIIFWFLSTTVCFSSASSENMNHNLAEKLPYINTYSLTETFPCFNYPIDNCYAQTIQDQQKIQEYLIDNQGIITEIDQAINTSKYYKQFHTKHNSWETFLIISTLMTQALLDFHNGNNTHALQNIDTTKKYLSLLNQQIITSDFQQLFDQYIDIFLTQGYLDDYVDQAFIKQLFNPSLMDRRSKEFQLYIQDSRQQESKLWTAFASNRTPIYQQEILTLTREEQLYTLVWALSTFAKDSPQINIKDMFEDITNNAFINTETIEFIPLINQYITNITDHPELNNDSYLKEFFAEYLSADSPLHQATLDDVIRFYSDVYPNQTTQEDYSEFFQYLVTEGYYDQNNETTNRCYIESIPNCMRMLQIGITLHKQDEQLNYHRLVYLKYLILKNQIQPHDMNNFLNLQGDNAHNTISQTPFTWDPNTQTLSTDRIDNLLVQPFSTMNDENKLYHVYLPFNH